jgi:hypothetical protein
MPKKTISLTLNEEQADSLQSSFGGGAKVLTDGQFETIFRLAVESWIDLFAGTKRYRSLTEQYLEWLDSLYTEVLTEEEPSERRLFSQCHFPYGQAQYLARILREQQMGTWRRKALQTLKQLLSDRLKEAKEWINDSRGDERMVFQMSKGCRVELYTIMDSLLEANTKGISPVRPEGTIGSFVALSLVASNVETVLNEVEKLLKGF